MLGLIFSGNDRHYLYRWKPVYLQFFDLLLKLSHKALFTLQLTVQTVDLSLSPIKHRRRQKLFQYQTLIKVIGVLALDKQREGNGVQKRLWREWKLQDALFLWRCVLDDSRSHAMETCVLLATVVFQVSLHPFQFFHCLLSHLQIRLHFAFRLFHVCANLLLSFQVLFQLKY